MQGPRPAWRRTVGPSLARPGHRRAPVCRQEPLESQLASGDKPLVGGGDKAMAKREGPRTPRHSAVANFVSAEADSVEKLQGCFAPSRGCGCVCDQLTGKCFSPRSGLPRMPVTHWRPHRGVTLGLFMFILFLFLIFFGSGCPCLVQRPQCH